MDTHLTPPPTVSVVVPVYNASAYLKEAIDSILYQSFTNFELIIIDDCSTDESQEIIKSYTDKRIRFFINNENLGVTKTLNAGLRLARGKYIARMDADDIALPQRLERQVKFLEKNADYGLVGSYMQLFPSGRTQKVPVSDEELRANMLFHNPFVHPAMMIRRSILDQYQLAYDESLPTAQDEELWFRIAQYSKVANIPEVLLIYRIHENQISIAKKELQQITSRQIKVRKIRYFMPVDNTLDLDFYQHWVVPDSLVTFDKLKQQKLHDWVFAIQQYNHRYKKVNDRFLRIQLANLIINFLSRLDKPFSLEQWWNTTRLFIRIRRYPVHFILSKFLDIFKLK